MDTRRYQPVSRYGPSPMPGTDTPVEVIRQNGSVHLAVFAGFMWRDAYRPTQTLDTLTNPVVFWRPKDENVAMAKVLA